MARTLPWRVAWVTGASTGIGREIASQLAEAGVRVAVSARSADKLASLGPNTVAFPLDVTDAAQLHAAVARIEADLGQIDLAVFAAGTYVPVTADLLDTKEFAHTMATNYMGVVNGLAAVLPRMRERRKGHVAWIASVAGYRGLPKAAAYGPSKAALINLAESLKPELARVGVSISVVNPGFVATPLTAKNDFPMPFLMTADAAASATIRGLARSSFEIAFPRRFVFLLKVARLLPYGLYFWLIDRAVLRRPENNDLPAA